MQCLSVLYCAAGLGGDGQLFKATSFGKIDPVVQVKYGPFENKTVVVKNGRSRFARSNLRDIGGLIGALVCFALVWCRSHDS